jgi:hypothetical protein
MTRDPASRSFGSSMRWLCELTHVTPQERLRLTALLDDEAKKHELEQADQRRSRLVDGTYGVLVVVETTTALRDLDPESNPATPEQPPSRRAAWSAPVRDTVVLPLVRMELADQREEFTIRLGNATIGEGRPLQEARPLAGPGARRPILETLPDIEFVGLPPEPVEGTPAPNSETAPVAIGPLALPLLASAPSDAGSLTLKLDEFLSIAGETNGDPGPEVSQLVKILPKPYPLYLGYVQFGSYCGWGARRRNPAPAECHGHRRACAAMSQG